MKFPILVKRKPNSVISLMIIKVNIECLEWVIGKFLRNYCLDGHSSIEDLGFLYFKQWESHVQLKERETFWQHRLKTFYLINLNVMKEYLY